MFPILHLWPWKRNYVGVAEGVIDLENELVQGYGPICHLLLGTNWDELNSTMCDQTVWKLPLFPRWKTCLQNQFSLIVSFVWWLRTGTHLVECIGYTWERWWPLKIWDVSEGGHIGWKKLTRFNEVWRAFCEFGHKRGNVIWKLGHQWHMQFLWYNP